MTRASGQHEPDDGEEEDDEDHVGDIEFQLAVEADDDEPQMSSSCWAGQQMGAGVSVPPIEADVRKTSASGSPWCDSRASRSSWSVDLPAGSR